MNSLLKILDFIAIKLLEPVKRFPLALFSAFIFTFIMMLDISNRGGLESKEIVDKITFVSALAFFFFISLRLMKKGWVLSFIGLIMVLGYYFYLPASLNEYMAKAEGQVVAPLMFISLIFLMIVSPFLTDKVSNEQFFEWLKQLIYQLLLSAGLGLLIFIVLNSGMGIIKNLFDVSIRHYYSEMIGLFSFIFVAVFFFLSQLPKEPNALKIKVYNRIEIFFVKYILSSLFILYFLIIYIYTGKMIFLAEYPTGVISWNIIAFSVLAILTYLFWTPLWNEKNEKYKKVIWIAIILQTILLAVALYLRVEPYGWTLSRVILSSLGIWLFVLSLYALIQKKISYQVMFISIPLLVLFNLLFASTISKISQQDRLGILLANNNALSEDSNISLRYNISSKIEYLYGHYGTDSLFPLLPEIVTEYKNQKNNTLADDCSIPLIMSFPAYATDKLGFKYIDKWSWGNHRRSIEMTEIEESRSKRYHPMDDSYQSNLEVKGYDYLINFNFFRKENGFAKSAICLPVADDIVVKPNEIVITTDAKQLKIEDKKEQVATIDLREFIESILQKEQNNKALRHSPYYRNDFTVKEFTYLYENNRVRVKLIFRSFSFSMKDEVRDYNGILLIGRKN